jgi:acetyl-CoA acetyltransferase
MTALAAIVGAAETAALGKQPGVAAIELAAEAGRGALADAGISLADVDGIATAEQSPIDLAHYMGIRPQWMDTTSVGGCSYLAHVRHAAAAIASGQASVVLVAHGESGRSGVGQTPWRQTPGGLVEQFEAPYGVIGPVSTFTLGAVRYMHDYAVSHEQLAMVAVAQREWAQRNPRAERRDPLTIDDVLASRMVVYPFHLPECCLVSDGGGALVVVAAERAADYPRPPVFVLGAAEAYDAPTVAQLATTTSSWAFEQAAGRAFAEAGLGPSDIDHLMVYDAFAHLPLFGLEDLGFVGRGEAAAYVAEGNTLPGGPLPMNTNGGGLSYTHTGMYGMFAMQESVRQLRGEAAAQVPGAETSFVQGVGGGTFTAAASLVLGREPS